VLIYGLMECRTTIIKVTITNKQKINSKKIAAGAKVVAAETKVGFPNVTIIELVKRKVFLLLIDE